jgi:hypothetical protein
MNRTRLKIRKSELKNKLFGITQEWKKADSGGNVNGANELKKKKDLAGAEFTVARLELELFDAEEKLRSDPGNQTKKSIVETTKKDLRDAQSKLPIDEQPKPLKQRPSEIDPTIVIPGISSPKRTWTFRLTNTQTN